METIKLRQLINEELAKRYPHECPYCEHFKLTGEGKVKMRFCRNPEKIRLDMHGDCALFVVACDVQTRKARDFTR